MSEFSDEAREWLVSYHGSIDSTALERAFDAGRASRDAEVAELRARVEAARAKTEDAVRARNIYQSNMDECIDESSNYRSRAEAAEAVIAAVEALADDVWRESQQGSTIVHDAGIMQDVVGRMRATIAAPESVLAERDRKNLERGWNEGALRQWTYGPVSIPNEYVSSPYTVKEQSK